MILIPGVRAHKSFNMIHHLDIKHLHTPQFGCLILELIHLGTKGDWVRYG